MENKITPELIKKAGALLKQEREKCIGLEKLASSYELEKRAQKIAFREVELGLSDPFRSFEEFQAKVASLTEEDLTVVEKALERGYLGGGRGGELVGGDKNTHSNPFERFVITGELDLE